MALKYYLLLCLLLSTNLVLAKEHYNQYCNARFAYCVDVPDGVIASSIEPQNGDGKLFGVKDTDAVISIYGSLWPSVIDASSEELLQERQQTTCAENQCRITYQVKKDNYYIASGYYLDDGKIFYQVYRVKNGEEHYLGFLYPKKDKVKMDKIVSKMTSSFLKY